MDLEKGSFLAFVSQRTHSPASKLAGVCKHLTALTIELLFGDKFHGQARGDFTDVLLKRQTP